MEDPSEEPGPGGRRSPVLTVVPLAMVLGLVVAVVRKSAEPVGNLDTYFHLRLGAEFLSGWAPWSPGQVSTFATADWVPTQWLSQVALAAFERWFGLAGVAWITGTMLLAHALAVFSITRRLSSLTVAAFLAPVVTVVSYPYLSGRPQVLSYLFVVVTVGAWLQATRTGRAPIFLVPLTWLWAMCHGMWPVGVLISVAAALGWWLDGRGTARPAPVRALAVPFGSAVVAALTPVGPGLYGGVLRVGGISEYFGEWQPASLTDPLVALTGVLLGVTVMLAVRGRPMPWTHLLLLLSAAVWFAYSARTVPVAAAITAPLLAIRLSYLVPDAGPPSPRERRIVLGGFGVGALVLAALVPVTSADPLPRPAWQVARLDALPTGTPVLNGWDDGGYEIWRWPELDFVMHGYGDVFTASEIERNAELEGTDPGWDDLVRDTGARIALVPEDGRLAYQLQLLGWTSVHDAREGEDVVLVAPDDW